MTEEEWNECADGWEMLKYMPVEPSERKQMVFAAACCQRVMPLVADKRLQAAIELIERLPEGGVGRDEVQAVCRDVRDFYRTQLDNRFDDPACSAVLEALEQHSRRWAASVSSHVKCAIVDPIIARGANKTAWNEEVRAQSRIVRDIFGNPFRPVTVDPRWQTETVVALASAIYADRSFDRMPILADAMEDAGCDHADMLSHCRGDGPHYRGCWVVDLLLGKS